MKTIEETKMNGEVYEAPMCKTIEMQTEGVLLSGSFGGSTGEDYEDGGSLGSTSHW